MRAVWVVEKKWEGRWCVWMTYETTDDRDGQRDAKLSIEGRDPKVWRVVKYVPAPAKAKKRGGR